jgi:hypothetical protein
VPDASAELRRRAASPNDQNQAFRVLGSKFVFDEMVPEDCGDRDVSTAGATLRFDGPPFGDVPGPLDVDDAGRNIDVGSSATPATLLDEARRRARSPIPPGQPREAPK